MPIDYYIDHSRKLVFAQGRGVFTDTEIFTYQQEVWTRPELAGYHELVDMTQVEQIAAPVPASNRIKQLAALAASHDHPSKMGKFALIAPSALIFGMGREYQTYREMENEGKKEMGIFRTRTEALEFLGIDTLENRPPEKTILQPPS